MSVNKIKRHNSGGDDDVQFDCPFCGRHCWTETEVLGVVHAAPACDKFLRLGPVDFLHAVNVALGHYGN